MNSRSKLDRFRKRSDRKRETERDREKALIPKLLIHDYTLTVNENLPNHLQCAFSIRFRIFNVEFFSFFLFSSVYIVVIHKCRRLFNGHTRRRRSHIEMPFQWTTHCQWIFLLLGSCLRNEIRKCGHRRNSVEYKLQVRIDYFPFS